MDKIIIQGAGFADNFGDVLFYDIFLKESISQNIEVDLINISDSVKSHLKYTHNGSKKVIRRIIETDGIVFIGGGYLGEPTHASKKEKLRWGLSKIKHILYVGILGMIFRKKIIFIGAGAGPISNPITKWVVKILANYSEKAIVRDKESYKFLKKIGVKNEKIKQTADTAILLKNYYNINASDKNEKSIVVHFSESPEYSEKATLLMNDVDRFMIENPEYHLKAITDHNGGGQNRAIEYLEKKYKDKVETHIYKSPESLINFLNQSSVVITNKLHIAIVSTTLNKSVISVPYHSKVKRYFKQINQSDRCISFHELEEGNVKSLLDKFHDKPIELSDEMFQMAEQNISYFNKFVTKEL